MKTDDIAAIAVQAMLYEVACSPSPGMVSRTSSGAHKDMDFFTFIDSTTSLIKYLVLFVKEGFSSKSPKEIFEKIREIGIEAEIKMLKSTKGVNTQRGLLFLMGIALAATGKLLYNKEAFNKLPSIIKEMTEGLVNKELYNKSEKNPKTHGEELFKKYQVLGIRGEVERGIPTVFNYSLPLYREHLNLNINDKMVHTLIGIMQYLEDTNILYRHSFKTLYYVQNRAKAIMDLGGMTTKEGREEIKKLDEEFSKSGISPGGSADLLAITVFFSMVKDYITEEKRD